MVGPENYSYYELAAIISEWLGTEVRYQQIAFDVLEKQFIAQGMTESFAQGMIDMFGAKNEGMDNVAPHSGPSDRPPFNNGCGTG